MSIQFYKVHFNQSYMYFLTFKRLETQNHCYNSEKHDTQAISYQTQTWFWLLFVFEADISSLLCLEI